MNWTALADTLGITTETMAVYRAPKRKYVARKGRLTKDSAIKDAVTDIAKSLDYCDCYPREPDTMAGRGYPGRFCECTQRIKTMVEILTECAKRLPESAVEWAQKITPAFWESYEFPKEDT